MVCDPGCFSPSICPGCGRSGVSCSLLWPVGDGMIENDWIPTAGATGYLYIPADAAMIELKDLRLEPTEG